MQGGSEEKDPITSKCANSGVSPEGFTPTACAKFVLNILKKDRIRSKQWNQ